MWSVRGAVPTLVDVSCAAFLSVAQLSLSVFNQCHPQSLAGTDHPTHHTLHLILQLLNWLAKVYSMHSMHMLKLKLEILQSIFELGRLVDYTDHTF